MVQYNESNENWYNLYKYKTTLAIPTYRKEAGRAGVQGHPALYTNTEASLGYIRSCLTKPKEKQNKQPKSQAELSKVVTTQRCSPSKQH